MRTHSSAPFGLTVRGVLFFALGTVACSSTPRGEVAPRDKENNAAVESTPEQAVLTQHNDNARTGAMLAETILNTSNVSSARFGKKASLPVRGSVTAQPLYVPNLEIDGTPRNVVYVATMHNLVYAFAGDGSSTTPLWGPVALGPSILLPDDSIGPNGYKDIAGEIGVISTPVISLPLNALFVVAATKEDGRFYHRLHRLDLKTGRAQVPAVVIDADRFVSERQNQRSSLLLSNGMVYVTFAAYGDRDEYYGFLFAYEADTLRRHSVHRTTTDGERRGGIWMAGQGPAADSDGNVYAITANGAFDPDAAAPLKTRNLGNSFIKLRTKSLELQSWFSPTNNDFLNGQDGDLGSSGAMLLPNTNIVLGAGKEGKFYLLDRNQLGYFDANQDDRQAGVLQRFFATPKRCGQALWSSECHHVHGSPVYWDGPNGPWIYVWPENDFAKAFRFDPVAGRVDCQGNTDPECTPISQSITMDPDNTAGGSRGMPGGFLSLSANGKAAGSGILWGLHTYTGNANQAVVEGILRAYDASNLSRELWNSRENRDRDDVGPFAKSAAPTIADGHVYVPSFTGLSRKTTLMGAATDLNPALAAGPSARLYLGWTERDGRLSIQSSTNGIDFSEKTTLARTSQTGPALAASESTLYLGFVDAEDNIQVVRSTDRFATSTEMSGLDGIAAVTPLPEAREKLPRAPALAVGNDRVFLAWTAPNGALTLISGASSGTSFDGATKVTFPEESSTAPDVAYIAGRLYLAWTESSGDMAVAYSTDDGRTLSGRQTLGENSNYGARLLGLDAGRSAPDLYVVWVDFSDRLNLKSAENAALNGFGYKLSFEDESPSAPAATVFNGRMHLAWQDRGRIHVSRYNSGELGVYGLL